MKIENPKIVTVFMSYSLVDQIEKIKRLSPKFGNANGGLFSISVQKSGSKVLKTLYFPYSACQSGGRAVASRLSYRSRVYRFLMCLMI